MRKEMRINQVHCFQVPKLVKKIQKFLGLANYYIIRDL